MTASWHALRTKPRKEHVVVHQVEVLNLEAFCPRIAAQSDGSTAGKGRPYFPGYVLIRADLARTGVNAFQFMPHAVGLVCFGSEPGVIPDAVVARLRRHVAELRTINGHDLDRFGKGDPVRITQGPLEGYEAIFDHRVPGRQRVKVLLELMGGRRLSAELSSREVVPVQRAASALTH